MDKEVVLIIRQKILESLQDLSSQTDGILLSYLYRLRYLIESNEKAQESILPLLWEIKDFLWEKLHSLPWNDESLEKDRVWFGRISCLLLIYLLESRDHCFIKEKAQLLTIADMGLLLGSPGKSVAEDLHTIIAIISQLPKENPSVMAMHQRIIREVKLPSNFLSSR